MTITPRIQSRMIAALGAIMCVGVTTGCKSLTVPWEHPTAFNKTPTCDKDGPCGDGCYVPPPPVMNSDCYGFRFTCWHPWPEHCQPQCNDGYDGGCMPSAPQPVYQSPTAMPEPTTMPEPPPSVPPMPPASPPNPASETPPAPSPTDAGESMTKRPRFQPAPRGPDAPAVRDWSRQPYSPPTIVRNNPSPPNYGFMSAVAESGTTMRDESVRPVSGVTRLPRPEAPAEPSPTHRTNASSHETNGAKSTHDGLERFRW